MKKYLFLLACLLNTVLASAQYSGSGNGTESDPYLIYNDNQLAQMANFLGQEGVVFKLMVDLDVTDYISENNPSQGWTPIGVESSAFKGKLYGNGHTISGLWISRTTSNHIGLIGYATSATISDLTLEVTHIAGSDYIGSLLGHGENCTVSNCHVTVSDKVEGGSYAGCLLGYMKGCTISNSSSKGNIYFADNGVGGFMGEACDCTVSSCIQEGNVFSSSGYDCGGFTGYVNNSSLTDCTSTGNVTATNHSVGGVAGSAWNTCTLKNCKSTVDITGAANVAGVVGILHSGSSVTFTGKSVNVYDVDGRLVRNGVNATRATEGLANGVYIVNGVKVIK